MAQTNNNLRAYGRVEVRSAYIRAMSAIVGVASYDPTDDVFLDVIDNRIDALLARRAALGLTDPEPVETIRTTSTQAPVVSESGTRDGSADPFDMSGRAPLPNAETDAARLNTAIGPEHPDGTATGDETSGLTDAEREEALRAAAGFPDSTGHNPIGAVAEDNRTTS